MTDSRKWQTLKFECVTRVFNKRDQLGVADAILQLNRDCKPSDRLHLSNFLIDFLISTVPLPCVGLILALYETLCSSANGIFDESLLAQCLADWLYLLHLHERQTLSGLSPLAVYQRKNQPHLKEELKDTTGGDEPHKQLCNQYNSLLTPALRAKLISWNPEESPAKIPLYTANTDKTISWSMYLKKQFPTLLEKPKEGLHLDIVRESPEVYRVDEQRLSSHRTVSEQVYAQIHSDTSRTGKDLLSPNSKGQILKPNDELLQSWRFAISILIDWLCTNQGNLGLLLYVLQALTNPVLQRFAFCIGEGHELVQRQQVTSYYRQTADWLQFLASLVQKKSENSSQQTTAQALTGAISVPARTPRWIPTPDDLAVIEKKTLFHDARMAMASVVQKRATQKVFQSQLVALTTHAAQEWKTWAENAQNSDHDVCTDYIHRLYQTDIAEQNQGTKSIRLLNDQFVLYISNRRMIIYETTSTKNVFPLPLTILSQRAMIFFLILLFRDSRMTDPKEGQIYDYRANRTSKWIHQGRIYITNQAYVCIKFPDGDLIKRPSKNMTAALRFAATILQCAPPPLPQTMNEATAATWITDWITLPTESELAEEKQVQSNNICEAFQPLLKLKRGKEYEYLYKQRFNSTSEPYRGIRIMEEYFKTYFPKTMAGLQAFLNSCVPGSF